MKQKMKQNKIAKQADISDSMLSQILCGKKRPSWPTAKKLARATNTTPDLWLDKSPSEIKKTLKENNHAKDIVQKC